MKLFEPGKIGSLTIRNRIVMVAMGPKQLVDPDGKISERGIEYYATRARGGVGLITAGAFALENEVEPKFKAAGPTLPRIDSGLYVARLEELADTVHDYGAKIMVQVNEYGRVISHTIFEFDHPVAPSAVPWFWDTSVVCRALTTEEVERLVQAYGFAAEVIKAAGMDAMEVLGHEGYLIDQFMTPLWNKRTDKYGGDLDGRLRIVLEILDEVKRRAGADFPVVFRYGLKHDIEGGREVEEGLEIARRLEKAGVDALHVDAGAYETWWWAHPPTYQPPGCMVDMAAAVKRIVKVPVIAVGKLGYPELAEKVLQEGKADFIGLGRALLADPEWPNKVKEGRLDDIRICIGDQEGCLGRTQSGQYRRRSCTVNPASGMERELAITPAEKPKSVLVVGGGPGGMEAARVAALRGHKVTLWEKTDRLGGNLIPASVPDFKRDFRSLIKYYSTQVKKLGVNVELEKEATPELVQEMKPDVTIIATGATHIIPEIAGIEKDRVVTAVDLFLGKKDAGQTVVVAGGDLPGCEMAVYLAQKGKEVTLIEKSGALVPLIYLANRQMLKWMLADSGVKVLTNTELLEITDEGIVVDSGGEKRTLKADTVVLALGFKPEAGLSEGLQGRVPELHSIGDCVEKPVYTRKDSPNMVINAIWEAYRAARLI